MTEKLVGYIVSNGKRPQISLDTDLFNPWIPKNIGGCVLWLRADLGVNKVLNRVSMWEDQSGNGHDYAQAVGGNQPLWEDAHINGKPSIKFNGARPDFLDIAGIIVVAQPFTVFVVLDHINMNMALGHTILWSVDADPAMLDICSWAGGYFRMYAGTPGGNLLGTKIVANNSSHFVSAIYNGHTNSYLYVNGKDESSSHDIGIVSLHNPRIGAPAGLPTNDPMYANLAEVVVFDSALSVINRHLVETYLKVRYNL